MQPHAEVRRKGRYDRFRTMHCCRRGFRVRTRRRRVFLISEHLSRGQGPARRREAPMGRSSNWRRHCTSAVRRMSNSKSWARLPSSRETGSPTQVWIFYSLAAGYPHSFRIEGAQPSRLLEVSVPAGLKSSSRRWASLRPSSCSQPLRRPTWRSCWCSVRSTSSRSWVRRRGSKPFYGGSPNHNRRGGK